MRKWVLAWVAQVAALFACAAALVWLLRYAPPGALGAVDMTAHVIYAAVACFCTFRAARAGLPAVAAMLAPAICYGVAYAFVAMLPPQPLPVLLIAVVGIVAAAAGEVSLRMSASGADAPRRKGRP